MQLKPGFSPLEVIFALVFSSIIALILFQSTGQMHKVLAKISQSSSVSRRVVIVDQQFDRDFSGVFSPAIELDQEPDMQAGKPTNTAGSSSSSSSGSSENSGNISTNNQNNSETKTLPEPFVCETNSSTGNVKKLTCITSNPVCIYGECIPRIVRVMYSLEPDPQNKQLFILYRQQSDNLDPKKFNTGLENSVKKYEVAHGIVSLKFEFLAEKQAKSKDKKPNNVSGSGSSNAQDANKNKIKKEPKKREFIVLKEWKDLTQDTQKKSKKAGSHSSQADSSVQEKLDTSSQTSANKESGAQTEEDERAVVPHFIRGTIEFVADSSVTKIQNSKRTYIYQFCYAPLYDIQPVLVKQLSYLPSEIQLKAREDGDKRRQELFMQVMEMTA